MQSLYVEQFSSLLVYTFLVAYLIFFMVGFWGWMRKRENLYLLENLLYVELCGWVGIIWFLTNHHLFHIYR